MGKSIEMRVVGSWLLVWLSNYCFSVHLWWLRWLLIIDCEKQIGLPSFLGNINGLPCFTPFMLPQYWSWFDRFSESLSMLTVMAVLSWLRKFTCTCSTLYWCSSACVYSQLSTPPTSWLKIETITKCPPSILITRSNRVLTYIES